MSAIEKGDVAALTNFHRTIILSDLFRERTPSKRRCSISFPHTQEARARHGGWAPNLRRMDQNGKIPNILQKSTENQRLHLEFCLFSLIGANWR